MVFQISVKNEIYFISDGCHSFGTNFQVGNKFYSVGDNKFSNLTTFSFHPVKNITTGEGVQLQQIQKKYEKLMLLRNQGIKRKSLQDYDIEFLTSNFRLSDLNYALGYSQLKSLKKNKSTKLKILKIYNKLFSSITRI